MNQITRCIHEARDHARDILPGVLSTKERELLVVAFLEERLAMVDILGFSGSNVELIKGMETEITGIKLKSEAA